MTPKLRPGWKRSKQGRLMKDADTPHSDRKRSLSELIAIRAYYRVKKRERLNQYPAHRLVLDGRVKLTPRRRELLLAVMLGLITWRIERNWATSWKNEYVHVPYYGETNVATLLTYLRKNRLVKQTPYGLIGDVTITVQGVAAAMEACDYENTYEKHAACYGTS